MQKFEMPKLDVEEFEIVDVIMTSLIVEGGDENEGVGEYDTPID